MPTKIEQTKKVQLLTRVTYQGHNYMPGEILEIAESAWAIFLNPSDAWAVEIEDEPLRKSSYDISEADNALEK